jgi:hypothetical protein
LQNLIMKLLVRHLCPLLLTSQHQLVCYRIKMSFCVRAAGKPSRPLTSEAQQKERGTTHLLLLASRTLAYGAAARCCWIYAATAC